MDERIDHAAEILRFIKKFIRENRGDGPQYTIMSKHFEEGNQGWRHATFSKYLTELQTAGIVEKRQDVKIGRPRYYVSKGKTEQAEDIVFKNDIGKSCTNRIQIPKESIMHALLNHQKRMDSIFLNRAGVLNQIKLKKKESQFFHKTHLEEATQKVYSGLNITMACPPGTRPPEISERGYESIIEALLEVTELDDVASKFQIILTRDLDESDFDFSQFERSVFLRWLTEIKGIKIDEEIKKILPYVFDEKEWQPTTNQEVNRDLLTTLMELCIEFRQGYLDFNNTYNKGARRFFQEVHYPFEEALEEYKRKHSEESDVNVKGPKDKKENT